MSELGKSIEDIKEVGIRKALSLIPESKPIGIKTPLERGNLVHGETLFKMHFDVLSQVQDNLKNLIMTQQGERLGFPDYGTSLRRIYSNSSFSKDQIANFASNNIKNAVNKYMPNIELVEFYSERADLSEKGILNDASNNLGLIFNNIQGNLDLKGDPGVVKENEHLPNSQSTYQIIITYNIPMLSNDTYDLKLFVNNSR